MLRLLALLLALMVVSAGCVSVGDGEDEGEQDGTDNPPDDEEDAEADVATGGDPEPDTEHSDAVKIPDSTEWELLDHHFRMGLKLVSSTEVGEQVRLTVDVGTALQEAGLRWVAPGVPLADIEADPGSVVMHRLTSGGRVQDVVPVEARQADHHSLEIAFEHIGGMYVIYFDDVRYEVEGGETASYPDAVDGSGSHSKAHWQGTDFWGVTATSGIVKHWPGDTVNMYANIESDAREAGHGAVPLTFTLSSRVPDDWTDVEVDPDEPSSVQSRRQVNLRGTSPEDASGSDTLFLDVTIDDQTVSQSFLIKYHDTS